MLATEKELIRNANYFNYSKIKLLVPGKYLKYLLFGPLYTEVPTQYEVLICLTKRETRKCQQRYVGANGFPTNIIFGEEQFR